jgi:cell wall-associated NlpC family hydrolase
MRRACRRRVALSASVLGALALTSCGSVESRRPLSPEDKAELQKPDEPVRIAEQEPPHPTHFDIAPEADAAPEPEPAPEPTSAVPDIPVSQMPPASAGTNGSYDPPASSERKAITPQTMARLEDEAAGRNSILLSGIALAPPRAPERIQAAISGANEIVGRPYIWGGGHASWYSRGYDCSGAVSYALAAGGFLQAPLTSGQLESWGAPGPGRWLTVYANAGHAYAVIAGLRWDTVGDTSGTGPRWHPALPYTDGFVARHPPGF